MPGDERTRRGTQADRRWWKRENWYRDIWLFVLSGFVAWSASVALEAAVQARSASSDAKRIALEQRQGRAVSFTATCAAVAGVIEAGRATITGELVPGPPRPRAQREYGERVADAYGDLIAKRVEDATGRRGLTTPGGQLDCRRLARVGKATRRKHR